MRFTSRRWPRGYTAKSSSYIPLTAIIFLFFIVSEAETGLCIMTTSVAQFAKLPFIRQALVLGGACKEVPKSSPYPILTFYYGVDYSRDDEVQHKLREGHCLDSMAPFWYGGGPEYDSLCSAFTEMVRMAGRQQLTTPVWRESVDGITAQLILCDQLSRNIFRGTSEAFAYDETSLQLARNLSTVVTHRWSAKSSDGDVPVPKLTGEVYSPYLASTITALMHSERLHDHETSMELIDYAYESTPSHLRKWWDNQRMFELEHKQVIQEFGRYPHRNKAKGRESTKEELRWLSSDKVPGWASSQ